MALVAGDSDYVPLVQRLRQDGCTILIIGTPAMSNALKGAITLGSDVETAVMIFSPRLRQRN